MNALNKIIECLPIISSPAINDNETGIYKTKLALRVVTTATIALATFAACFMAAGTLTAAIGTSAILIKAGSLTVITILALTTLVMEYKKARRHVIPEGAIGKKMWADLMGTDIGKMPPVPQDLLARRLEKGEMLVLFPATLDGQPFTPQKIGELYASQIKELGGPRGRLLNASGYQNTPVEISKLKSTRPAPQSSYWGIMGPVIDSTRNQPRESQKEMMPPGARFPRFNEAVTWAFLEVLKTRSTHFPASRSPSDIGAATVVEEMYEMTNVSVSCSFTQNGAEKNRQASNSTELTSVFVGAMNEHGLGIANEYGLGVTNSTFCNIPSAVAPFYESTLNP